MAREVNYTDILMVAHDLRLLLTGSPERLLWSPGRPIWGIHLLPETTRHGRPLAVVSIDGCMTIAETIWPSHFVPGGDYELDAIVRVFGDEMRLARRGETSERAWFSHKINNSLSGDCCVLVAQEDLPWVTADYSESDAVTVPVWTARSDPLMSAHLVPIHPWLTLSGQRSAMEDPAGFFSAIGEPPEMTVLPDALRQERLVSYWRLHAIHEAGRCEMAQVEVPAWLVRQESIGPLAEAWVKHRWRGPGPAPGPMSVAKPFVPVEQPSLVTTPQVGAAGAIPGDSGAVSPQDGGMVTGEGAAGSEEVVGGSW